MSWLRANRYAMCLVACLVLVAAAPAVAQPQTDDAPRPAANEQDDAVPTAKTHPHNPELWNVEKMMEDAVKQISRRYNLNPAQENYTRMLLTARVTEFLAEHEEEVRALLKESIDMQLGRRPRGPAELADWASRASPVYAAATKAILDGNDEWREILDEQQKSIHDQDVNLMRSNFQQLETMFENWQQGKGYMPGQARPVADTDQPGDGANQAGGVSQNPPTIRYVKVEDNWLAYVNKFIQTYDLNETQQNSARAKIHADVLAQARAYRGRYKTQFEKIERALRDPSHGGDVLPELMKSKRELEKPVRKMFVELDERLDSLLLKGQEAKADPDKVKELEALYRDLAGAEAKSDVEIRSGRKSPDAAARSPEDKPATGDNAEAKPAKDAKPDKPEAKKPRAKKPAAKSKPEPKQPAPARSEPKSKPSD